MGTKDWAKMFERYAKLAGHTAVAGCVFDNLAERIAAAGLTICNLKPLAELLGCEPVVERISEHIANRQTWVSQRVVGQLVAQVLNWERTEFDTLDELLEELRAPARVKGDELGGELRAQSERLEACLVALEYYADTGIYSNGDVPGHVYVLDDNGSTAQVCLMQHGGRKGGYIPARAPMRVVDVMNSLPPTYNFPCSLKGYMPLTTPHTLLHAGELYRGVTILLRTEQLVAWRTADGQEYSARAHQVLLDPDEDGLAAAILSRISGVEIAPEHMAELRAQMAGGVTHG
ncbi:hypothetical protein ACR2VJ_27070 [Klebsiella pneumoniae]